MKHLMLALSLISSTAMATGTLTQMNKVKLSYYSQNLLVSYFILNETVTGLSTMKNLKSWPK